MAPWSLSSEIWEEARDPAVNPEISWEAQVRLSTDLCDEEKDFLSNRRQHTVKALAKYLGVPESDVHPDDVPVIAMCGSGGGIRALVSGAGSCLAAAEDGLFDCVTYTAGVSGSCWLQTLYFTSIGQQNYAHIIKHLKDRLGQHIAYPPPLLDLLSQSPTNKYLLKGFLEKLKGVPDADFGLVDLYGLTLAARLLVPHDNIRVNDGDLKLSNQRIHTDKGNHPLPIYTAVRHEIPEEKDGRDYFQWFEWTPYEFFSEELEAGIPTWALGRKWSAGHTVWPHEGYVLPQLRVPMMMGMWGSAFCATLSHYYREVRPLLTISGLGRLDALLTDREDEMSKVHPIDPAVIPNYALGLKGRLPAACSQGLLESTHLQLMDAGMANNLPIYPLLRPGRQVDVIIAFDASADVREDNWIGVVDGYVRQRNIKGWPMGAGWPSKSKSKEETRQELEDAQAKAQEEHINASEDNSSADLGSCTVWVGTKEERGKAQKMDDATWELGERCLSSPNAGITLVYFPFLKNATVEGVDPMHDDYMSTWNFVYTPEQIEKVTRLAQVNFNEGRDQTRRTIRAVWEGKRRRRLGHEYESQLNSSIA
ncbi:FabD/lysophospholipase-like protein [Piedraia hortae CBS 480.64]|uniref:Lysophospholipase n=1 Tax=Piedraia hortae CBS 480.64 TaxID=1314780 RepID=A0A6A7BQI7_9PEZI|nr:FabD/lysophospholipase-like protein [Piedraia hortae CBS 480.64]